MLSVMSRRFGGLDSRRDPTAFAHARKSTLVSIRASSPAWLSCDGRDGDCLDVRSIITRTRPGHRVGLVTVYIVQQAVATSG